MIGSFATDLGAARSALVARAWLTLLGIGVVLAAVYLIVPAGTQTVLYLLFGAVPGVAMLAGVRLHQPGRALPWTLLGIGLVILYVGDVLAFGLRQAGLDAGPAEVAYLAGYPIGGAGLFMLWADRRHLRSVWIALLDGALAALGALVVILSITRPWEREGEAGWGGLLVALPGPIVNIVVVIMVLRLVSMSARWSTAERLLLAGVVTLSLSDSVYSLLQLSAPYPTGTALDSLFILSGAAMGASALHSSMRRVAPRARHGSIISLQALAIMVLALATIPASATISYVLTGDSPMELYLASLPLMLVLVLVRTAAMSRALVQSERRFGSIINRSRDAFTIIGPDGTVQWRSENVGQAPDAIKPGENVLDRVHPDDRARAEAALGSILSGETADVTVEVRLMAADGDVWWVEANARNLLDNPDVRGVVVAYHDITERRRTLDNLAESESRLAAVFDNASIGIGLVDPNLRLVEVNPAMARIVGWSVEELEGRSLPSLVHADDREQTGEMVWQTWTGEREDPTLIVRLLRNDASDAWASLSISRIQRAADSTPLVLAVIQDVTAERRAMERVEREQRRRVEILTSLQRLRPAESIEETAQAFCTELQRLREINVAAVYEIRNDGILVAMGIVAPSGAPVQRGAALPKRRSAYLLRRLRNGSWLEQWEPRTADGRYGQQWASVGMKAAAYAPITGPAGELVGAVVTGYVEKPTDTDDQIHVVSEFATVGSALFGGELVRRRQRQAARGALQEVIDKGAFRPVFQPIVDLRTRAVVGYEALTRFDDGASPEGAFALADQVGLGRELERVTMRAALAAQKRLPPGPWLGVNVSPNLLLEPELLTMIQDEIDRPIILEVTEHVAVENYDELREALRRFDGSVRLAVDDAGAGFASLQHIVELHPEIVKLHSGLVRDIQRDPVRQALVAGMRYFAESTGCALLAEGVEQNVEARALRRLGVDLAQGYLFGRPAEVEGAPALTAVS